MTLAPYGLNIVESCLNCKLRTGEMFCNLSPASLRAFEHVKFIAVYPERAVLFVEGQSPHGVFIICKGRVKLSIRVRDNKRLILQIAGPGEMLGLSAAVSGQAYELAAETMDPCQVTFVKRDDFLRFVRENPDACIRVAEQLSEKYTGACNFRSRNLARSPAERLARLLLEWVENARDGQGPEIRLTVTLTHDEIGEMIEASRETVTRWFSRMKKQGILKIQGSTLIICNEPRLREMSKS